MDFKNISINCWNELKGPNYKAIKIVSICLLSVFAFYFIYVYYLQSYFLIANLKSQIEQGIQENSPELLKKEAYDQIKQIGYILKLSNEFSKAFTFYEYALRINRKLIELNVTTNRDILEDLETVGLLAINIGMYSKCLEYFRKALTIIREEYGDDKNGWTASQLNNLGVCYEESKGIDRNYNIALHYYKQSLKSYKRLDLHSLKPNMNLTSNNIERVVKKIRGTYDEI